MAYRMCIFGVTVSAVYLWFVRYERVSPFLVCSGLVLCALAGALLIWMPLGSCIRDALVFESECSESLLAKHHYVVQAVWQDRK